MRKIKKIRKSRVIEKIFFWVFGDSMEDLQQGYAGWKVFGLWWGEVDCRAEHAIDRLWSLASGLWRRIPVESGCDLLKGRHATRETGGQSLCKTGQGILLVGLTAGMFVGSGGAAPTWAAPPLLVEVLGLLLSQARDLIGVDVLNGSKIIFRHPAESADIISWKILVVEHHFI